MSEATLAGETLQEARGRWHVLRLYVLGMAPASTEAIRVVREVCEELLPAQHELEIIDLYDDPDRAGREQIVAAPTLVREAPLPRRRVVGSLSKRARVLEALALESGR